MNKRLFFLTLIGLSFFAYSCKKIANLEAKWTEKSHAQIMEELKLALNKRWKIETSADEILKRQIKFSKYIYLLGGNLE